MSETEVRLPDGTFVTVPTSDPKVAAAAAKRYMQARSQNARPASKLPKPPPSVLKRAEQPADSSLLNKAWNGYKDWVDNTASPFVDNVVDNMLPNWGDELRGAGQAIRSVARGRPASEGFEWGQRTFKEDQARFKRERPTLSTVSAGTGMVAGVALPAGKALKGATMLQKARQGAQVGAAYGAAAGAGEGEGLDLPRRVANAASSGAVGAAFGAATPGALRLGQEAGRWARVHVPGVDRSAQAVAALPRRFARRPSGPTSAEQQANRMLGDRMNAGTIAHGPAQSGPAATPSSLLRRWNAGTGLTSRP